MLKLNYLFFFFSSRRRHTRWNCDWSSDVCSSDLGAFDAALELLAAAEDGSLDEFQSAQADLLRGQIALASSRGSDAAPLLLTAARRFEPLDVRMARDTYLDAFSAALFAGRLASEVG